MPLRPIFRQLHPNFINVRTAYASEIWAQLTKNLLAKSSTKRFREYITEKGRMACRYLGSTLRARQNENRMRRNIKNVYFRGEKKNGRRSAGN
ncbi:hypothetical protein DW251_06970 [Clostridium sp. AM22-11AC]|nr:hypothetical protein DW251_06970 [Clostridium sp. AM22-11AC]